MAKSKRGKGIWNAVSRGRGTCPVCLSTRIKLLYTANDSNGKAVTVCKKCNSAKLARVDKAILVKTIAFRGKNRKTLNALKNSV